jgi:hypothetical protein
MTVEKDFEPDCREAFDRLRGSLIELYAAVDADPECPQEVARRFRINKTLTWNLSKVIASSDPIATLPNVPGPGAFKSMLDAVQRAGASSDAVERVREAAESLHRIVRHHIGDRATLELVIDGMGGERDDHLELSRKLAFRGNSGLWGVQAKTRLMTVFMAANREKDSQLDMAIVRGFVGFRRLRSNVQWPVFQVRGWGEEGDPITGPWQPLDESDRGGGAGLSLLREFSTVSGDDLDEVKGEDGTDYLLAPGKIGNAGAVDFFMSDHARAAASKYRTEVDTTGEFGATISAPTERLVFDLIVDEALDFALKPQVLAYCGIFMDRTGATSNHLPIPVPQNVVMLPGQPPAIATPNVPRYSEIVNHVYERMGWDGRRFRGCRMELMYPPLGSTVLLRFDLPEQP